jgi:hypothetical protein
LVGALRSRWRFSARLPHRMRRGSIPPRRE